MDNQWQILLYEWDNWNFNIEVHLDWETVWLSQNDGNIILNRCLWISRHLKISLKNEN